MSETIHEQPSVQPMGREFATQHIDELVELAKLIPKVSHNSEDLLTEVKSDGHILHAKWDHSFFVLDGSKVIGFIMGYEREAEANENYPINTIYISELAVLPEHQGEGLGLALLKRFLSDGINSGFSELKGKLLFSLQTNAADWNKPVQELYAALGFTVVGHKQYENRTDVVMRADPQDLHL